ncbi:MAG TPA: CvpA family protein [Anaerolineales bacterium]|jgi:hypothetical protein|nr:CvpA family protein [Anaerolineales bacterium]HRF48944.1 CvpA family protein [Anaerolineales bacterium]
MMSITAVFWMLVVIFGIIGGFRGWAKEVLVLFSLILALFLMRVLQQYVPGVQAALDAQGPQQQVILRSALMIMLAYFGYQTPNIPAFSGKLARDKLQDFLLGSVIGLLNGYFIVGTIWYYLDQTGYPWPGLVTAPPVETVANMMPYMPPRVLGEPYIFFAIGAAFVFVIIVFL